MPAKYITGSDNIEIGNVGVGSDSGTIRIGGSMQAQRKEPSCRAFSEAVDGAGVAVLVNSNGRLYTSVSSARFKDEIKPMDKSSEAILALKPVTFRYKKELDPRASRSLASWPSKWKK